MTKKTFFNSLLRIAKGSTNSDVVTIIFKGQNASIRRNFSTTPYGYMCLNVKADFEYSPCQTALPGKKLAEVLKSVTANATIAIQGRNKFVVQDGSAVIELNPIDARSRKDNIEISTKEIMFFARVNSRAFKEAVRKVRPTATVGIGYEFTVLDGVLTIGSDRKSSLSFATLPAEGDQLSVVVPCKAVTQFIQKIRVKDSDQIEFIITHDVNICMRCGSLKCYSELLPNSQKVFSREHRLSNGFEKMPEINVPADQLRNAFRMISKVTPNNLGVNIEIEKDTLTISTTVGQDAAVKCPLETSDSILPVLYKEVAHVAVKAWLQKVTQEIVSIALGETMLRLTGSKNDRIYVAARTEELASPVIYIND
ncbi:MAG: hypothetical protein H0S79_16235 [Anaerolineaceae bacterium]|nr:hypothetical protein [Anaerolineaceae bacterium]